MQFEFHCHIHLLCYNLLFFLYFFKRTPEANSRASSPCHEVEQFQIIPAIETSYLARAGKNEFLNLVPDIEEIRPG